MMGEWKHKVAKAREGVAPEYEYYCRLDPENPYRVKYVENFRKIIWTLSPFHKVFVFVKNLAHHIF